MANSKSTQDLPPWLILLVAGAAVLVIGFFGWRTLRGSSDDAGPPKQVRPGMYDLRAEAAKSQNAPTAGSTQNDQ